MSHLPAYLGGALTAYFCSVAIDILANRDRWAKTDRRNWQRIAPGAKHWISLAGSVLFTIGLIWIRTVVGSARADPERQLQMMNWFVLFFAVCSFGCLWQILRIWKANVFWRGSMLCFSDGARAERLRPMTDVTAMAKDQSGSLVILFSDAEVLKLDPDAKGVPELFDTIIKVNGYYLTA